MGFKSNHYDETNLEITVKKDELLAILRVNRDKHKNDYDRAIYYWQKKFKKELDKTNALECTTFPDKLFFYYKNCPESCIKDYDDVIDMFEMSINETIILNSDAYRKFCKDEWSWKSDTYGNHFYKNLKEFEDLEVKGEL